jgi:DNA-binding response OmpR family regulator
LTGNSTLAQAEALHPLPRVAWKRVLVIDDDSCVGLAIQTILTRRGCETMLASRGQAGIGEFQLTGYDVAIVDIFLPGMNGLETIKRLRYLASMLSIIAISGFRFRNPTNSGSDFLEIALQCGATAALHKPFTPRQLISTIDASFATLADSTGPTQCPSSIPSSTSFPRHLAQATAPRV